MPSPGIRTCFWFILAVAFLLRLGTAIGIQWLLDHRWQRSFVIEGDANGYWHLGERIAAGEDYSIYSPPRHVLRMPGFPALLSIPIRYCSSPFLCARILLTIVGTIACALVYLLSKTLYDSTVGLTAMSLSAIAPALIGFTPLILSETLFAAGLLGSLIAVACLLQGAGWLTPATLRHLPSEHDARSSQRSHRRTLGWALATGLLIGMTCYVRPSWLLAAPVLAVAIVVLSPDKPLAWAAAVVMTTATLLTLVPWGLRNQRVTGHFVLTTLWVGPSLYDGLNPSATGESDMAFFDRDNLMGQGMSEYDVDRHYRAAARNFVVQDPQRAVELALIKLWRFVKPWPNAAQFSGLLPALVIAGFTIPVYVLTAWGCWTSRTYAWGWLLTLGPFLYFAALHMVFVSSLRYRLPTEYPMLVMTAVGIQAMRRRPHSRPALSQ